MDIATRDELLELERGFWAATGDPDHYRGLFADQGRCVFSFGTLDKAQTIASIVDAPTWISVEFEDIEVVPLGADSCALTYTAYASQEGRDYEAVISSVYVREDGRWLLALHHQIERP